MQVAKDTDSNIVAPSINNSVLESVATPPVTPITVPTPPEIELRTPEIPQRELDE